MNNEVKSKFGVCYFCKKPLQTLPFNCHYCGEQFCKEHRLPENHDCPGDPQAPPPP